MKYRKKPIVIEAVQYANNDFADNAFTFRATPPPWVQEAVDAGVIRAEFKTEDYWYLFIKTLEGEMRVGPDDWIIRGVNGELYPCKPDIFEKSYEPALP